MGTYGYGTSMGVKMKEQLELFPNFKFMNFKEGIRKASKGLNI